MMLSHDRDNATGAPPCVSQSPVHVMYCAKMQAVRSECWKLPKGMLNASGSRYTA